MENPSKNLILVAGEASGDMHGAHLVRAIQEIAPLTKFAGLGGPKMRACGVELYQDLTKMAVVGFWEVIKHYGKIRKAFHLILEKITSIKPDAVILIDYPGFNLRLAKELKKRDIKVIYYISPQVWAWKKNRVYSIAKNIHKMLVLFPFEVEFYARYGVTVKYVGHPLVDSIYINAPKEQILQSNNLSSDALTIGILPGSREKEVEQLLPIMLDAAKIMAQDVPKTQFLIIKAPTVAKSSIERHLRKISLTFSIIENNPYDGINACDLCIVASGTATLETAMLQRPMVIVYKTSLLTWLLAKCFVKIDNIGLVNVVMGKRIVPECIQFQATGPKVAAQLKNIMTDEIKIADIKIGLKKVKESLGPGGASQRAAAEILNSIR